MELTNPTSNSSLALATPSSWQSALAGERAKTYFKSILAYIERERASGKIIYPKNSEIFNAFKFTPLDQVKVVIVGQDPYHGPDQAHGLSFSVRPPTPPPPSLKNIFKELHDDLGIEIADHGNLESWARQGVLLLNSSLSVENGKAGSHSSIGWDVFTDKVIALLNEKCSGLVFLLWGSPAQRKAAHVDGTRHHLLKCSHPSPLSAYRGFFGCRHFSKTNELLIRAGKKPIEWSLAGS